MRNLRHAQWVAGTLSLLASAPALAATYYVSTTGGDTATGSESAPFATLTKANGAASAGDTIYVRGGTFYITTQLVLSKSGTSDTNRTKIWAYPGETPVLDASKYVTSNAAVDVPVVLVTGNWMHLKGLEIANAKVGSSGDHSYSLLRTKNASNNTFELLNLHHGFGPGLFIDTGTGGNLILNCDSHDNYDVNGSQGDGQNGDGFGVHYQTTGPSTIIRGCRAWYNSDDGYDLISQEVPVTIEGCFAIQDGQGADGNGNGFKVGSSLTGVRHLVRQNVAWKNKASGFYANHSTGGNTWYNNTSYNNGTQYNMLASSFDSSGNVVATIVLTGGKVHIMRNNIGFPNKNSNMDGVDTAYNTWDLGITEASTDFASTSDTGCTGPRETDGSMPAACTFLHLKAGSPLIDKGTNVNLPYVGAAPDLGAFEYGATSAGGASGTGGSPATGGAATGGSKATGGSSTAGGVTSAGGTKATGGSVAGVGAAVSTGGASTTGGLTAVGGGAVATTGGRQNTGGLAATGGGIAATGGRTSSGTANTGGAVPGTGGVVNAAGGTAAAGASATGGAVSSGGAVAVAGNGALGGSSSNDTSVGNTASPSSSNAGTCSCRMPGGRRGPAGVGGALALLGIAFVSLRRVGSRDPRPTRATLEGNEQARRARSGTSGGCAAPRARRGRSR
jgi:hypothetical protein